MNNPNKRSVIKELTYTGFKRFFDIFVSLGLLVFAVPLMIILSLIIRCNSSGPAIYCQQRLTANRRIFTMFKFRTMVEDAEISTGATWAAENDPRVTRLGKFMRKTRLDELPQLINVLIGDMSLIGPRPERPEFAKLLQSQFPHFKERYQVPAGLSGLAQISSGYADSIESYETKLKHDLEYVSKRSILLDLNIAVKTIKTIFTGYGAR
jgi:lipopolysaccharide/colanic/teichoic acid biosynthesis glycosyltransferase